MNNESYMVPLIEKFVIDSGRNPADIYTVTQHAIDNSLYFVLFYDNTFLSFIVIPPTLN